MVLLALLFGIYVGLVAVITVGVVMATSDRYRGRFRWLVQDEPEETWNG